MPFDVLRYAGRVAVRRVVIVLVVLALSWIGIGRAAAATSGADGCTSNNDGCNRAQAYAAATALADREGDRLCKLIGGSSVTYTGPNIVLSAIYQDGLTGEYRAGVTCSNGSNTANAGLRYWYGFCPTGSTWDEATKRCHNPQQCLDKAGMGGGSIGATATVGCIDGCAYAPPAGEGATTMSFNGVAFVKLTKGWVPTGAACTVESTPEPSTDDACKELGAGQTACVTPEGKTCYSVNGVADLRFCWNPGETGQKTHDDHMQKTDAGQTAIPPNMQLPSGDSLTPNGPSTTTTITNDNRTITTITNNYNTSNGTDAGSGGNQGDTDGDGEGDGEEDGDGKGASGGTSCDDPPIVTGDAILGVVATQTWAARCATEEGNAANVTGDVGNCAQPFSVEGDNANAHQLRALRAEICKGDSDGDGQPDWTDADGVEEGDGDEGNDGTTEVQGKTWGTSLLDQTGFTSGSCPSLGTIDFGFTQFSMDSEPMWCDLVSIMRAIMLIFGAFTALRILMD